VNLSLTIYSRVVSLLTNGGIDSPALSLAFSFQLSLSLSLCVSINITELDHDSDSAPNRIEFHVD
jgi:hypothetical protein